MLSLQILVGAIGAPFFGWVAERLTARTALLIVVAGLTAMSVVLWVAQSFDAFVGLGNPLRTREQRCCGLAHVSADRAFRERADRAFDGRSDGLLYERHHAGKHVLRDPVRSFGKLRAGVQSYTVLMLLTTVPVWWLQNRGGQARVGEVLG